jgi:hypothetical protein
MPRADGPLGRVWATLAGVDRLDLATRLTLILFLVSDWVVSSDWVFSLPLRILGLAGLLVPPWNRRLGLWLLVLACMAAKTVANWWTQDNHHFLLTYWCVAVCLALPLPDDERDGVLARSAKLLLGLSFLFASLWKGVLSPDFIDGSYFHYTFLTDDRFTDMAAIIGQLPDAAITHNRTELGRLYGAADVTAVTLQSTPLLRTTTRLVTWWTQAIETALAVTFLWPGSGGLARLRNWVLLVFAWTTYPTVPNVGVSFGWTLMIVGTAATDPDDRLARMLYAVTCAVLMVYHFTPFVAGLRALAPWAA